MKIAIIGMGYVGATLAGALAPHHEVFGVDPDPRDFHEPGLSEARTRVTEVLTLSHVPPCACYIICVGTPVGSDEALRRATREVAIHMRDGALVIVRSTVAVGTTRNTIRPILDGSGLLHYQLAVCPERTVEGNALAELAELPQIIGAESDAACAAANAIFLPLGCGRVFAPTYEEAEMAKLLANSWRDVTFAYANEVALLAERYGVSARNAIQIANRNYPRCAIPVPGPVGGPCLVKDSALLTGEQWNSRSLIMTARGLNEHITFKIARNLGSLVNRLMPAQAIINYALLGTAFKGYPETDDTRDTPSLILKSVLEKLQWNATTVDPAAPANLHPNSLGRGCYNIIIVATNAPVWRTMNLRSALAPNGFIYDCCGGVDDYDYRFGG